MHRSRQLLYPTIFFFFSLILSISSCSLSITHNNGGLTVYQVLSEFGLPSGLLPGSVKDFSLAEDGRFIVELENPCYVHFDYLVYYDRKITGTLKHGSITNLQGIEVKKFFLWLNVDTITVDSPPPSDYIYFQVGLINKKLDIKQFETVHSCKDNGIGFSCPASWSDLVKVPTPTREISMLITE